MHGVRVLLSTYGSRGGVEPVVSRCWADLAPGAGAHAGIAAATLRTVGSAVAAPLLLDTAGGERTPIPA